MRILYLGLPLGALWLARHGLAPAAVVLGHPEAPGGRRIRRALPPTTLVLGRARLDDEGVHRALASIEPDVIFSFFWPRRIPTKTLALAPRGAFGTHPSLLPRWRGPDPYFWALRAGDLETGVTLHRLEADYDTGAIVESRRVRVEAKHDAWTLARALDRPALSLLVDAARRLGAGESLEGTPQDGRYATHAPEPSEDECSIDWSDDAESIVRLVRACAPTPGAIADVEGETVEVRRACVADCPIPRALEPAEAFVDAGTIVVRAGRGGVRILDARDADGEPVELVSLVERARRERDQAS